MGSQVRECEQKIWFEFEDGGVSLKIGNEKNSIETKLLVWSIREKMDISK